MARGSTAFTAQAATRGGGLISARPTHPSGIPLTLRNPAGPRDRVIAAVRDPRMD